MTVDDDCDHVWAEQTTQKEIPLFGLQEVRSCLKCSVVRLVPPPISLLTGHRDYRPHDQELPL